MEKELDGAKGAGRSGRMYGEAEREGIESVRMSFEKFAHVRFCFRKASSPRVRGTK